MTCADKLPTFTRNSVRRRRLRNVQTRSSSTGERPALAPKSSLEQLVGQQRPRTLTKGRSFLRRGAWTMSASFSLPAQFAPVLRTGDVGSGDRGCR